MKCFQVIPVTYSTSEKVTILASNYNKRYNLDWLTILSHYFNNVPHKLRYSSKKATTLAVLLTFWWLCYDLYPTNPSALLTLSMTYATDVKVISFQTNERTNSNKYKSRVYCQLTKEANF